MISLILLYFTKDFGSETSDILSILDEATPEDNESYVAHYFDLRVDKEIDPDILCELDPSNQKMGVFADERSITCQEILNEQQKVPFNIYEGGTEIVPGDIC